MNKTMPDSQARLPLMELAWPCGDRSYGRGRWFRYRAVYRRLRWHWQHRRQGGVNFPPGQWWSLGTLSRYPAPAIDQRHWRWHD